LKAAVIDIGTNSTRLYVAEINQDGQQQKIIRTLQTTRLGEGIGSSKSLLPLPMERTSRAIVSFVAKARGLGAENIYIYATSAVRDAENKAEFAAMLKQATGSALTIIPGELEARIAYMGAAQNRRNCAVIDIGGGSTEVVRKEEDTFLALSLRLGAVRLQEAFPTADGRFHGKVRTQLIEFLEKQLPAYETISAGKAATLLGVSGAPTALAAYAMQMDEYDGDRVQGYILTLPHLKQLLDQLCDMNLQERKSAAGIPADRADIIVYSGHILYHFMRYYGYQQLEVSDRDSLEGYMEYKTEQKNAVKSTF